MRKFFVEVFTDTKGRPEIKMILGVLAILAAFAYGLYAAIALKKPDWAGFGAVAGLGVTLIGATTIADAANDSRGE